MVSLLTGFFVAGVVFASGPCLASCGPLLVSYLAGTQKNMVRALLFYSLFSLSRIVVYVFLSATVFFLGTSVSQDIFPRYLSIAGGLLVTGIGVLLTFERHVSFPYQKIFQKIFLEGDLKNSVVFGLVIGLIPCVPFIALLSYIGLVSKTWQQSCVYTVAFGLGTFFSPLLGISLASGALSMLLKGKQGLVSRMIGIVSGLVMIFLGMQLIRKAL